MRRLMLHAAIAGIMVGVVSLAISASVAVRLLEKQDRAAPRGRPAAVFADPNLPPEVGWWVVCSGVLFGVSVIGALWVPDDPDRYRYTQRPFCVCGYDVRGLGRCPECGRLQ